MSHFYQQYLTSHLRSPSKAFYRGLIGLISLFLFVGCKVQLATNEGGSITTKSGTYECNTSQACPTVNVVDLFFDETFVAQANTGYEFSGWKVRDRGLCGGNKGDCRLFTAGFAGNAALMGFLENDQVFYLEADFTPKQSNLTTSEGLWVGQTNANQAIRGIVLSDGSYYIIYSVAGAQQRIAGVVIGNSTTRDRTFTSANALDFSIEYAQVAAASVSATVIPQQTFQGLLNYPNGNQVSFSASYHSDYEIPVSLSELAGVYTGTVVFSLGFENATMQLHSNGSISGMGESGCKLNGNLTPRSSGNVYDLTVEFGGSPCYYAYQQFNGILYYDRATKSLYTIAPHSSRTDGFLFIGN